jgi:hypothetical protein
MSDHLRRANDELDGAVHRPSREEIVPPTDREVEQSRRGPSPAVEKMIARIKDDGEAKLW